MLLRPIVFIFMMIVLRPGAALAEEAGLDPDTTVVVGSGRSYSPALGFDLRGLRLEVPLLVAGRVEGVSSYPVDRDLTALGLPSTGNVQARVGLRFNTRRAILPVNIGVEYEHDVVTGAFGIQPDLQGVGYPSSEDLQQQLRKACARISLGYYLHLVGGFNVSHWGMGLVANDGAHGWTPGSTRFSDPRGGDRVLRLALATGPLTRLAVQAAVGFDWVQGDDVMLEGDSAWQAIGAVTLGHERPSSVGVYAVWRRQQDSGGDETSVAVVDLHARHTQQLPRGLALSGELEAALIYGTTHLASSTTFPEKRVRQLAVAARARLQARRAGAVLDFLYASGDADTDDGEQNAFRPDPNFDMGLLLYRHVLAGQTARSVHTASDLELLGRPADDVDRFPTRGSASNTVAVSPRAYWRPARALELYGGPLFAFTASPYADPLNTRLSGGTPRNPLDRAPSSYLGTELDLGARFQALLDGTLLEAGLELGVLFPGSALAGDGPMSAVYGGRLLAAYRF